MTRRGCGLPLAVIAVVGTVVGIGIYVLVNRVTPYLHGTGCDARTSAGAVPLDPDQAANAATVSTVAIRRKLPEQAVVIAYATALQESKLENLDGGDLDSVGLFQQRPSQGWGTATNLEDPAYATGRFFDALVKVRNYQHMPVEEAAQKVQRSADGSAYAEHTEEAKILAGAFTGRRAASVRCWYPPDQEKKQSQPAAAASALHRISGRSSVSDGSGGSGGSGGPGAAILVPPGGRDGWAAAAWMVAHAKGYGLREIRFAGMHWKSDSGYDGWTRDGQAPSDRVTVH